MGADTVRDVLIIGSGAGGGTLAFALARAGCDVLVLEKGPRYGLTDYAYDEVGAATQPDMFVPSIADDPHVLVDTGADEPQLTSLGWIASCVGGGTVHMGGSLYRFHPDDFRLRSRFGSYQAVDDWPYTYDDLEPYYSIAEWQLGIAGTADSQASIGHRSQPYPMPPIARHVLAHELLKTCRAMGLHPFATPRAVNSQPYDGRPACVSCLTCAGRGCPIGAKGSIQATMLRRAEQTGRCEIRTRATARQITVDKRGRATGCLYINAQGQERRIQARVVSVSASAVESARLLLLSTSAAWPDGLANGSGHVGRNLQFHISSGGQGRYKRAGGLVSHRQFASVSVMDHYFIPSSVSPFPKGAALGFDRPHQGFGATVQTIANEDRQRIKWGVRLKRDMVEHLTDYVELEFEAYQDFIPNENTFVTLDPTVKDRSGVPVARMHIAPDPHHRLAGRWLRERGLEILDAIGADTVIPRAVGTINRFMVHGTCRAGHDPARSVLNPFCQAHEVPNLFVLDGSFMPTCGGVPSTLTIIANSLRTADYILDRARTGDVSS